MPATLASVAAVAALHFVVIATGNYHVGRPGFPSNPARMVRIERAFEISTHEVTNAEFAAFVSATHYVTFAEKEHNALIFDPPLQEFRWREDKTAYWRFPNGRSRGGVENKMDHPVTCISYEDAIAYCRWANVRLPTLDEWEVAARAGTRSDFFFGSTEDQIQQYANIWHGNNHLKPDKADGYVLTSPVGRFKPNPWGLYDVYGNVFEFCTGKLNKPQSGMTVHARGGSWWCSNNACRAYNSFFIGSVNRRASFSNLGFRVVRDI